jgi:hypothetical protein
MMIMDDVIFSVVGASVTKDEAWADPAQQAAATARAKGFQFKRTGMLHCISTRLPYQSGVDAGLQRSSAF